MVEVRGLRPEAYNDVIVTPYRRLPTGTPTLAFASASAREMTGFTP